MLYRVSGEAHLRDIAFEVASNLASRQQPDGSWVSSLEGYGQAGQPEFTNADLDVTAEFTLWLALIATHVLARDGA